MNTSIKRVVELTDVVYPEGIHHLLCNAESPGHFGVS